MPATATDTPISFDKTGFRPDPAQLKLIERLQQLHRALVAERPAPGLLGRLLKHMPEPVLGLYIWGGVGRGKTHLMDHFFEAIPFTEKQRIHFHRFMQGIHAELKTLPRTPDPLQIIAKRLASKIRLLCLDEFHVNDIGDAMLLAGVLKTLFKNGVTLVTTSNIPADRLYQNGLQRERFLPAIDLLKHYTDELHLDGDLDYRSELLELTGTFHIQGDSDVTPLLQRQFNSLAPNNITLAAKLEINQREISTIAVSDDVAWFEFGALCETPRSSADYLEIAREYHAVIISDVPQMSEAKDDAAQRFIHLVDTLYDHSVKTIISAAVRPADIYTGRRHGSTFQRTASRLQEMASEQYLSKAHRS